MPSIITHDTFGQDIYRDLFTSIGGSRDEAEAFLLGNQGPTPCSIPSPARGCAPTTIWATSCTTSFPRV